MEGGAAGLRRLRPAVLLGQTPRKLDEKAPLLGPAALLVGVGDALPESCFGFRQTAQRQKGPAPQQRVADAARPGAQVRRELVEALDSAQGCVRVSFSQGDLYRRRPEQPLADGARRHVGTEDGEGCLPGRGHVTGGYQGGSQEAARVLLPEPRAS